MHPAQQPPPADPATGLALYVPLVLLFVLAAGFAIFSVVIAPFVGPRRYNRAKLDAYECGIEPSPQPIVGGGRMPVAYYLTAMLFILFDIEMVFLYPFAVSADALGVFGLVEIALFIITVGFAYVYVWRRGGLDWN
ncbi:NADH-quinone oxidoreductase subunit A [Longimycelium tulufanense]|uniref:NADH-quinone oxidoreductase subunit A n=1 Tax=Longimycelium tulufanense TaxID=907463 RepID=UPI0016666CF9|nr:NADH-quinone oxidoreductase subunit A [Longimycelium tulufanense]